LITQSDVRLAVQPAVSMVVVVVVVVMGLLLWE
jgi:hypothetical protein